VPARAWDTHIHVFDPDNFPYGSTRSYTPKAAQLAEYPRKITGCENIVVVHASVQGSSSAALIDTLSKQRTGSFKGCTLRGLATIDPRDIEDDQLDKLHAFGVRGARLHKMSWGHGVRNNAHDIVNDIKAISTKTARLGWIIGIFCPLAAWAAMADDLRRMDPRTKIVADHFGAAFPGMEQTEEFKIFLELVRERRIYVKISGFERLYHGNSKGIDALEPIAKAIFEIGSDQVLFGTDWPHTGLGVARQGKTDEQRLNEIEGFRDVPDAEHIRKLREWIPNEEVWQKLFVSNAERLFT
jgi:predicted TIM-barrel fold metal-dependent hydrolase